MISDAAAQRLDKDEEIFKTDHMFDKEDAMVAENTTMFSDYVLPTDISKGGRRSLLVTGVNDPDEKGEVRISFGNFFAAKTEELGKLGDGDENRPRPQFSATRLEVSPTANTPRPLYRPSSPEGSEEEAVSRQTSNTSKVVQAKPTKTVQNVKLQEEKKAVVDMTTRSLPYGAEDKDKEKRKEKEKERTRYKIGNKSKTSNIDPNSSAFAALQFCQSSQGSKIIEMSDLDEIKSLASYLAKATQGDSREFYQVIVNFFYKKKNLSQTTSGFNDESSQRLNDVFYSEKNRLNGGDSTIGGKQASEEPDGLTFYHSDTSCDVCPTESRFETSLATVPSPPLDTSSPKSTGSSTAVQTESNDINQTFPIPSRETAATTVTTTASLTTLMTESAQFAKVGTLANPSGTCTVGLNTGSSLSGISASTTYPNVVPTTDQTSVTARNISASVVITPNHGRTTYPTAAAGTTYPSSAVGPPSTASTVRTTYPPPTVLPTYPTPTVRATYPSSAVRAAYPAPPGASYPAPAVAETFTTPSGSLDVAQLASKGRTVSSNLAMFNNRVLASNKTLQPHPRSAFHPRFFNSQATESRVGDVIDPSLTHVWTGASEVVKQLGHHQQEVWNWRTECTSQIQMIIPPVLDFSGVLCVGMSAQAHLAIYNPTSRWIRCSSRIISCTVNGVKVGHQSDCPFSIRETTLIGPKMTEKVKVHFECLAAGIYVATMKVVSTSVGSLSIGNESSSALVTVEGFAEQPKLEILADKLDFGELHHGCNARLPLRLVNKGMTAIPLKMMICSSVPGMFVFSKKNLPDEIEKLEIHDTALMCLLPSINDLGNQPEPLTIWIELVGKSHRCFEKSDEAELFTAGINIQLDTGIVVNILGNIQLRGVIGFTKIQIPKAFQMAMCLSSHVGQRVSRQLPFSNAGNICADVELTIPKYSDVFAAAPNKFQVRPGMAVMVEVSFSPRVRYLYESVIQVSETDGSNCYDVLLRGSSVEPKQVTEDGPPILSNKSWLCWTGVVVGKAEHKRLFLLNDSSEQSIHFQAVVLGQHSDFEIQRTKSDFTSGGTSSEQLLLRPKERMPIYVLFAPSSLGVFRSALVLKPDRGPRFQIPFYAYGGTSDLSICDINKTTDGYVADLGQVSLGHRNILKITVKNSGRRAAFVKVVCYADFKIHLHYPQTHLSIVPSEFILPERSSKELVIVYQPLQQDAQACQSQTKRVATVVFYYGDEVIRQWYRRNLTKQQDFDGRRTSGSKRYDNIRFDKVFQDENCVAEEFDFPDLENWDEVFDNHLSQMLLNLHGGPEKLPAVQSVTPNEEESSLVLATPARPRSMNEPRALIRSQTPAQKESALNEKTENYRDAVWSLVPEQLILKVPLQGSGDSPKKVQLINFSDRPLEFEFIWPAHCIAVTPHRGTIPPKNQVLIHVSVWPSISSSGIDLPWSGTAYVNCDGVKKTLAFQINNHLVSIGSLAPAMTNEPAAAAAAAAITDADKELQKQNQPLQITPKAIQFSETQVGNILSSFVALENISMSSLRWQVSSVAPAYAKVSEASSEILRATYPVFCFSTYRGLIRAGQIVKIEVTFQTRDAGDYCQMWDFQINPENPLTSTKIQMELSGKTVPQNSLSGLVAEKIKVRVTDPEEKEEAVVALVTPVQELPSKQTNEPAKDNTNIYIQSDNIQFPDTEVGKTSMVKIKICNKSSSIHQFKVTAPQAPFSLKCSNIFTKPAHYLKIPVCFAPGDPCKHYEGMVVFENTNSGEFLSVRIRGKSLAK